MNNRYSYENILTLTNSKKLTTSSNDRTKKHAPKAVDTKLESYTKQKTDTLRDEITLPQ